MSNSSACTAGQSLLELKFNATGLTLPVDSVLLPNGTNPTLFAVTVPSNGTVIQSYLRHGEFVDTDGSLDVSLCLPAGGCYGLVDFTGVWPEDQSQKEHRRLQLRWNGANVKVTGEMSFPYYLMSGDDLYSGMDSIMSFTEFGSGCSLQCGTNESLYEVQFWAGNTGASHSWRVEDAADGRLLMGCNDNSNQGTDSRGCGTEYDVRVSRACLPIACHRFLYGNPNHIAPEGSFTSDRNPMYTLSTAGAYNPRFVIAVDGNIVQDSSFGTQEGYPENVPVNFGTVEIGNGCPTCPDDKPSLLEVFTYRTRQSPPLSITLSDALDSTSTPQNLSLSSNALQYERLCLPRSSCYDLQVSIPGTDPSYWEPIRTVIKLDSVYYANQYSTGLYDYSHALGSGCTKQALCAANESLVQVGIDMSQQMKYTPSDFVLWFLYDVSNPPEDSQPHKFTNNFDLGYPAGSQFHHYVCAPNDVPTAFGMFNSIPLAATWSVEMNGQELSCRQPAEVSTNRQYLGEVISTRLDGSCPSTSSLSAGAIAGIVIGSVAAAALALFLVRRYYCGKEDPAVASIDEGQQGESRGDKLDEGASGSGTSSVAEESPPAPSAPTTEVAV